MLSTAIGRRSITHSLTHKLRDAMLTLLLGLLAGNVILAITGGIPLATPASAAVQAGSHPALSVSDFSYHLNPANPALVDEIHIQASTLSGTAPDTVSIRIPGQDQGWSSCMAQGGSWVCRISGTTVSELTNLEVIAN